MFMIFPIFFQALIADSDFGCPGPDRDNDHGVDWSGWSKPAGTTVYWDCSVFSCSQNGKGNTNKPCNQINPAFQPKVISEYLSYGFAAAAAGGNSVGLQGDAECGKCYHLVFVDKKGNDHEDENAWHCTRKNVAGRHMVIQVTNIGGDVKGQHAFDLQVPGGGVGANNACGGQKLCGTGQGGRTYGGCTAQSDCNDPAKMDPTYKAGCNFRFDVLQGGHGKIDKEGDVWHDDNPWVRFKRVKCPKWHTDISGFWNNEDGNFPAFDEEKWKKQLRNLTKW